ncbi:hypothetical protein BDN70DRAFT_809014, partial [Pholiota conissans]
MSDAEDPPPNIVVLNRRSEKEKDLGIDDFVRNHSLNTEQARAFRIVVDHSNSAEPEQLRMYIAGCSGTGKSRVISSLKSYFEDRDQGRRLRLAAFTGSAAKNIGGVTLHSALMMHGRSSQK